MKKSNFTWIPFYMELANKVLAFRSDRTSLIEKVKSAHEVANKPLPKIENDNNVIPDIDPFTVFALFNRGKQSNDARFALCRGYTTQAQYDVHTLHSGNLYQIFTYVKNKASGSIGDVSGVLLYARTDEGISPDREYKMSGNTIAVKTLNLDCNFEEIRKQLDSIVEKYLIGIAS